MTHIGPYELDTVTCADALAFLAALPDGCADAVVTDPPYGTNVTSWDVPIEAQVIRECVRISREFVFVFYANTRLHNLLPVFRDCGIDAWVIAWHKPNAMQLSRRFATNWSPIVCAYKPNARFFGKDVLYFPLVSQGDIGHPTPKPVKLVQQIIEKATDPGALIVDPFIGSGTTAIAARSLGRHFLGCDVNPEYVALCNKRLGEAYTPPLFVDDAPAPRSEQLSMLGDD